MIVAQKVPVQMIKSFVFTFQYRYASPNCWIMPAHMSTGRGRATDEPMRPMMLMMARAERGITWKRGAAISKALYNVVSVYGCYYDIHRPNPDGQCGAEIVERSFRTHLP